MSTELKSAAAVSHPNIAFIKYWGNRDHHLRIPASGSISMNLGRLETRTRVTFNPALTADRLILNGEPTSGKQLQRVQTFLDHVRRLAGIDLYAEVESKNDFPTGAGIASSASAFSALALAAAAAAGLQLSEAELSRLARRGSGSACRSVPGGFVEWLAGEDDQSSYAVSIAPADHWDLVDIVAVISQVHKPTGSTEGHALAETSPLQKARLKSAPARLEQCRTAILRRDFEALAEVSELDCNLMHAVMMTGARRLLYWQPATIELMHAAGEWRRSGIPVFYTIDAGPNVHLICPAAEADRVAAAAAQIQGIKEVLQAPAGSAAHLLAEEVNL